MDTVPHSTLEAASQAQTQTRKRHTGKLLAGVYRPECSQSPEMSM